MARIAGEARVDNKEWTLVFKTGWQRRLRVNGFFAGHHTKDELKARIIKELSVLNAVEEGDLNLKSYITSESPPTDSISKTGAKFVELENFRGSSGSSPTSATENHNKGQKFAAAGKEVSRDVASLGHGQGDQRVQDIPSLPVSYSTRSAEKKSKLEAAEKRKLAASEKRRFLAAQKKQKLVNDRKSYALGTRKAVTRSSSNL